MDPQWKAEFDRDAKIYEIFRDYVKHEDGLTSQRMGWFLALQPLFLAAYGVLIGAEKDVPGAAHWLRTLRIILCVFGAAMSFGFGFGFNRTRAVHKTLEKYFSESYAKFSQIYGRSFPHETGPTCACFPLLRWAGSNTDYRFSGYALFAFGFAALWLIIVLVETQGKI